MRETSGSALSCSAIRKKLNNALAAGPANAMERETASHLQACDGCRDYYGAQTKLYEAVGSGVRHLVEATAPPSLLPGVRERLAEVAHQRPNPAWVRALVPSTVVLLVASGLLFLMQGDKHKVQETRVASRQSQPPKEHASLSPGGLAQDRRGSGLVALSNRPPASRDRIQESVRSSNGAPPVIFDRQEAEGLAHLASEIGKDPELGLILLHGAALPADQPAVIQPLNIAEIEIQGLGEENR
jgi:hypothetical protein